MPADRRRGTFLILLLGVSYLTLAQRRAESDAYADRLVAAAVAQTGSKVIYDGSYRRMAYPGGDVPESIGVCTDVVIRAYRRVGVDLQVKVHEDMTRAFRA
jgi:uncharacterized protein